jgi:hypothetical protein
MQQIRVSGDSGIGRRALPEERLPAVLPRALTDAQHTFSRSCSSPDSASTRCCTAFLSFTSADTWPLLFSHRPACAAASASRISMRWYSCFDSPHCVLAARFAALSSSLILWRMSASARDASDCSFLFSSLACLRAHMQHVSLTSNTPSSTRAHRVK